VDISNEVDEIDQNIHEESTIDDTENEINMNTSNLPGPSQYDKTNYQSKKKKNSETPFQSKLLRMLEKSDDIDPDVSLLMSFLNHVKKLTEEQKLDFQSHVINFFKGLSKTIQQPHNFQNPVHESNSNNPLPELSNHSIYNINSVQSEVPYSVQTNYSNSLNPSLYHNIGMPSTVSTYHSSDIYQQSSTLTTPTSSTIPSIFNPYLLPSPLTQPADAHTYKHIGDNK